MEGSYKKDFQRWKAERETEGKVFYNRLSEVIDTDNNLTVGYMVIFTNDYGVEFGPHEVWGFNKPTSNGRSVYFDHDAYWFPARPHQLTIISKGNTE